MRWSSLVALVVVLPTSCLAAEVEQGDGGWHIENPALRVTVDPASGAVTVLDKRIGYTWRQAAPLAGTARLAVPRIPKPPAIDGDLRDWTTPVSFMLTPDMVADAKAVDGPNDLSGEVRLAWDDRALYLAVLARDEKHAFATAADAQWWEKDSVEFWVDARQFGVALDPAAPTLVLDAKPIPREGAYELVVREQPGAYTVEAAVPWQVLGLAQANVGQGNAFQFALGVNDADDTGAREGQLYYPTSWVHSNPATFAQALFADEQGRAPDQPLPMALLWNVRRVPNGIAWETTRKAPDQYTVTLTLPNDAADLVVETDAADRSVPITSFEPLAPFALDSNQAFMPFARYCDGLLMDCDDMRWRGNRLAMHGADMPWIGLTDLDKGYLLLAETPDDGAVELEASDASGKPRLAPVMQWENAKGQFRYPRRMMISFVDHGGYVAICKRYRTYAKEHGLLVTQREKQQRIPDVAKLAGAPDIWGAWGLDFCRQAKAAGIDRMIVNWRGSKEDMEAVKALGYLISEYDNYVDIQEGSLDQSERAPLPASAIKNAKGEPVQGWVTWDKKTVFMKLCPALAVKAASLQIPPLLEKHPFNARFLDVTTASGLLECYDAEHPLTREEYRRANEALAKYVSDLGLVLGGEHGRWYGVPYYSYWEGMQSGGFYSWPAGHVGVNIPQTREAIGEDYLKYGIGHVYRVPLWELVFHDCVVSTWYWGDSTGHLYNAAPDLADKQDASNVLYGTVPLYWVNQPYSFDWRDQILRERLLESYRNTCKLHEQIGFEELVSHEFVTEDHAVQKTVFGDGTEVWVNFGEAPWTLKHRKQEFVLPQYGFYAKGPKIEQYRTVAPQGKTTTLIRSDGYLFAQGDVPGLVGVPGGYPITLRREGPAMIRVIAGTDQRVRVNPQGLWPDVGAGPWRPVKLDGDGRPYAFGGRLEATKGMVELELRGSPTALLVGAEALRDHAELVVEMVSPKGAVDCRQGEQLDLRARVVNLGGRKASQVKVTMLSLGRVVGGGYAHKDGHTLAETTVDVAAGGEAPVSFRLDTTPYDVRHLVGLRAEAVDTDELCTADNLSGVELLCRPDLSLWDASVDVTVEMGRLSRHAPVVRMAFDADVERAAVGKPGKADPDSLRVEVLGDTPLEQRWCPTQYVDAGPERRELVWQLPGDHGAGTAVACRVHFDGLDAHRHALLPRASWPPDGSGYRGQSCFVKFGEGYIRGLTAYWTSPATQILANLGASSGDTGWVDEVGEVQSLEVLQDGPVLTEVRVKKSLRGGHSYEKLYTFYPDHFEVTTLSPERFGTLSRAYYSAPCWFEDDKGNDAIIDGKGDAEDVSGKNVGPKWYATWGPADDAPTWALSCVAVTPHDSLTYWDAGSWGGVGLNTGRKEPATVAYFLHRADEPGFSAPGFAALDYERAHNPVTVTR